MNIYRATYWTYKEGDMMMKFHNRGYSSLDVAAEYLRNACRQVKNSEAKWAGGFVYSDCVHDGDVLFRIDDDGVEWRRGFLGIMRKAKARKPCFTPSMKMK